MTQYSPSSPVDASSATALFILRDPSQGYCCKYDRTAFIRTMFRPFSTCNSVVVEFAVEKRCLLCLWWPCARPSPRPSDYWLLTTRDSLGFSCRLVNYVKVEWSQV